MSSIPKVAQLRQMQALNRRKQMEDSASRAAAEDRNSMFAKHHQNQRYGFPSAARFAMTNRPTRDRNAGVITAREWEEAVTKYEDSGKHFRKVFYAIIVVILLLLGYAKYDVEVNLEVPQIESGKGFGEIVTDDEFSDSANPSGSTGSSSQGAGGGGTTRVSDREMEELYRVLGVQGRLKKRTAPRPSPTTAAATADTEPEDESSSPTAQAAADADKQRRRENYRVRQELKHAYEKHQEGIGQLVHCGRSCEAKNQQVELAYTTLASQVDRELYGVLLDVKSTKSKRSSSPAELQAAYETKKAEIEASADDEEDRLMALEELKDAYDILSNNEARTYYHLYGQKPPQLMKHMSARHGGWGQEVQLGTFKYRMIFAWLDYFGTTWAENAVLAAIAIFILMRLPQALQQTQRLVDELEWEEKVNQEDPEPTNGDGSLDASE